MESESSSFISEEICDSLSEDNNLNDIDIDDIQEKNNCLNCNLCQSKKDNLKFCKICHKFICEKCIKKQNNNNCPSCNTELCEIKLNIIKQFLDNSYENYISYKISLEENQKLKEFFEGPKCLKHDEKIEFYCFNCLEKLCGICFSFINKISNDHENHFIIDYSLVEKYQINEIF